MNHEQFMQRCFQLAANGLGNVAPNPLVGAVVVHEGKIIGEGFHARYGGPHAEVTAIRNCKQPELLSQSTLYVNLEPCTHFGKTPPCADLVLDKKIPRVIICNPDPFPEVAGRGIKKLRDAGVDVQVGVLEQEGEKLNRRFFTFHRKKRPYIILKWAQSADGFLDGHDRIPSKITGPLTDQISHQWRSHEMGILVGYKTALKDNPRLNARLFPGNDPIRMIWDPKLELPDSLHVFSDGEPSMVFNDRKEETIGNIHYVQAARNDLAGLLYKIYERKIQSVIIEGGNKTLQQFIDTGLWDEARIVTGNVSIGHGVPAPTIRDASLTRTQVSGTDIIHFFENAQHNNHDKTGYTGIRRPPR